jgi:hypothetical protein
MNKEALDASEKERLFAEIDILKHLVTFNVNDRTTLI